MHCRAWLMPVVAPRLARDAHLGSDEVTAGISRVREYVLTQDVGLV